MLILRFNDEISEKILVRIMQSYKITRKHIRMISSIVRNSSCVALFFF